jgi:hypothetical protein
MVGASLVGPLSVGGQHDSQPVVIKVFESVGEPANLSMIRLNLLCVVKPPGVCLRRR